MCTTQIFVSSTYKDLIEERSIAINTIMQLGHIPAGMEIFSATGSPQLEVIKPSSHLCLMPEIYTKDFIDG